MMDRPEPSARVVTAPLDLDAVVPEDHHLVLSWAEALDHADYLALLDLSDEFSDDELRAAFHVFAERFHPDAYGGAPEDVLAAANAVFQRGAEAYRVLRDPVLRARYRALCAEGVLRMPPEEIARGGARPRPTTAREAARTAVAAPFAARADELAAAGDLKQARLQLQLATLKEPDNDELAAVLRELDARLGR